jgi:hypothetical protein
MTKLLILICCLMASYFVMTWIVFGYWEKALVTGVLGALVFSTTFLAASLIAQDRPWRAFWIANAALILLFGGAELYGMLSKTTSPVTRFGARLTVDGHITAVGFASLAFDVGACTLSNFFGFYLSRFFIKLFNA